MTANLDSKIILCGVCDGYKYKCKVIYKLAHNTNVVLVHTRKKLVFSPLSMFCRWGLFQELEVIMKLVALRNQKSQISVMFACHNMWNATCNYVGVARLVSYANRKFIRQSSSEVAICKILLGKLRIIQRCMAIYCKNLCIQ